MYKGFAYIITSVISTSPCNGAGANAFPLFQRESQRRWKCFPGLPVTGGGPGI